MSLVWLETFFVSWYFVSLYFIINAILSLMKFSNFEGSSFCQVLICYIWYLPNKVFSTPLGYLGSTEVEKILC